jgi:hypothetical protein
VTVSCVASLVDVLTLVGYTYRMRTWLAAVAVISAWRGSCLSTGSCPCGQTFDHDPFGSDEGFYVGAEHDESVHCFCRCGDGPPDRLPPSATCEAYEGPCEDRNGEPAEYTCD